MFLLGHVGVFCPPIQIHFANYRIGGAYFLQLCVLPLYFQSIHGATPANSGIRILPLILAMTVFSIGAATFITVMGMPMYIMLTGAGLACIASALVYTLEINTSSSKEIAYLVLLGCGYGFSLQTGIIVGQAASLPEDTAATSALLNCTAPEAPC
jgi:MFS transporter, DHA2 family, glioxin efflux transporter